MTYNTDDICRKARELALQHTPAIARTQPKYLWNQFQADVESLRAFAISLQDSRASCVQPAEEWLLDNAEFIEEQALQVKTILSKRSLHNLPQLHKNGLLRIHSLCNDYLEQVDGVWNKDSFATYVNAYQEVSVLMLAECWSIPTILRIALIGRIASMMELVRERRDACLEIERLLARIEPAELKQETIHTELEAAGLSIPLSGPRIVHLIGHLREWAGDSGAVREWLMCQYENGSEELDHIVTYEHQLQAAYQVTAGNLVTSLRNNERMDWNELFEQISLPDRTFRQDEAGIYIRLDASSRNEVLSRVAELARRMRVPENLVASETVALAATERVRWEEREQAAAGNTASRDEGHQGTGCPPRRAFTVYYLFDSDGIKKLVHSLRKCSQPRNLPGNIARERAVGTYFTTLIGLLALVVLAAALWIGLGRGITPIGWIAIALLLLMPASEWVITWLHFGIERVCRPRRLLRYDFSEQVPPEAATMVVIPAIWSSKEEVDELADRLEIHYLANRDSNIHYALLGDFTDSKDERLPEDEIILESGKARIEELNQKYSRSGETTFHFLHRRRQWNSCEKVFMGWERKRGKLVEFVELLKGNRETSYDVIIGDQAVYPQIRYIITLDTDTRLPIGSAQRMIGTLHLPYNRPRLNAGRTRVVEGYGVLQPRIGISHESAMRSRLANLWSEPGMDPYAFAASDPYQDALAQGIFTGKGIFDVDVFAELLCERIPKNTVLSHDLLEGGFLRTALLSDIELIDDHPSSFLAYQKRMHRWVRGDWQLICWLFTRICDRRGVLRPIDLSIVTRWHMIDNLRRSLLPVFYFIILALSLTVLPGASERWVAVILATMLLPAIKQLFVIVRSRDSRGLLSTASHVALTIITLPFQSVVLLDAIGKSLYRLYVSKRRLLEWTSSSHIERYGGGGRQPAMLNMAGAYTLIAIFAAVVVIWAPSPLRWLGFSIVLLWLLAPLAIRWLDEPIGREELRLDPAEEEQLHQLAKQIWSFYEDFAGPGDHYLPPDNVQIDPPNEVAHRTSPTNIGFLLTAVLAAKEFGFIETPELVERLERTISTVERMDKWNGHLYNWYDTISLATLPPAYVSTVDSGNFVASLMTVKQGLVHWLSVYSADGSEWTRRGHKLIGRLEQLIVSTDFRPLYDYKAKLFVLGYHASSGQRDNILYDLLASEARQTSFVAIALGQISVSHWLSLGRTVKRQGNKTTLISWSGTMFEYMMPWLIMRTYSNTIWDSTYRGVVRRQIEYARERGVPFGISESGYYAFDYQMNYQYRAFGVPGLGFQRGLENDLVVAPYATIMALPYAPREGLDALRRMKELGMCGKYGFYEAMDFTTARMPDGESHQVIRSFMAHHQGMSLLTLANMLLPNKMYDYFHRDKRVQAAELLLIERIPPRRSLLTREFPVKTRIEQPQPAQAGPLREYGSADTALPEVNVHSNGTLTSVTTNSGSGFIRYNGMALTRWREDPVLDPWGSYMYIRDVEREKLWSPAYLPCRVKSDSQRVQFTQERTQFLREDDGIETKLEISVSPEWDAEIRLLTLSNKGSDTRIVEVTTFLEIALALPNADKAHPAFTKLFIQTEYDSNTECLLARKRPRNDGEKPIWAFHTLIVDETPDAPAEFETNRPRFIGRGNSLARPAGIEARLDGMAGSVADPAFIMRRRLNIEPNRPVKLIAVTGAADTKEQALEIVARLSKAHQAERSMQLAWTRSQIELQHLRIMPEEAAVYQALAGRVLFPAPLRDEQAYSIAVNQKGQQGLWAYGISGDQPIIMVRIAESSQLPFVQKVLTGYIYLTRNGLPFDLVIMNESAGGYQQDLREAILRLTEQIAGGYGQGRSGVHVLPAVTVPDEDKSLLFAVARCVLRADGPSLRKQLQAVKRELELKQVLPEPAARNRFETKEPASREECLFFNGSGGFTEDGKEYQIDLSQGHHLPAPWINVMANPKFGCLTSELYTGYTWWRNSRECKLTPWSNEPALDPPGEICYLRDEDSGEFWQMVPSRSGPDAEAYEEGELAYKASYGQGYTRYEHESRGLQQEMTVFVTEQDPVKVIRLKLRNTTSRLRRLSVTYYAEWVLGVHREGGASYIVTEFDEATGVLTARNAYQDTFRDATAFLAVYPNTAQTWTGDRQEFLGRNGTLEFPAAMSRSRLSGYAGPVYDGCGAIRTLFEVEPGAEQDVYILLGCESSRESATSLARRYLEPQACEQALDQVRSFWENMLSTITVSTPSKEMDLMLNRWLLYQTVSCRMWARTAFYQAGGAYGFRDQLQDSLALLHSRPDLTRSQIMLHASHQYEEGDVQHWWHEETHRGIRTRFSDDLLWLPYAVLRYIEHTGDRSILEEAAPFLHSAPLGEEEHERYEPTVLSGQSGTILEHCLRAIDRSLRFGEHGLPLIGIGDWNDGMSMIGPEGRGESVWLGWFLGIALSGFADLCGQLGEQGRADRYRAAYEQLVAALNEEGWDGKWYRRAFMDAGHWLGSIRNSECRIDSIAQSWSVISGMAPPERALQAMRSFDRELVNRDLKLAHILTPPFDKTDPSPGYIQGYPPGIRENGGQYTHGVIWSIVAWSKLGEGNKAFELFRLFNPITHTGTPSEVRTYVGEPYAMAADVYTEDPLKGHAGWTWYTGASGWMYQAGIEWILGLRRRGDRLYIRPCIPAEWPGFSASYRCGSAEYHITVRNPEQKSTGQSKLSVDGQEADISAYSAEDGPFIELRDDHREHRIELTL